MPTYSDVLIEERNEPILKFLYRKKIRDRVIERINSTKIDRLYGDLRLETRRLDVYMDIEDTVWELSQPVIVKVPQFINKGTRSVAKKVKKTVNRDLPDHQVFYEQGNRDLVNEHIDVKIHDAANGDYGHRMVILKDYLASIPPYRQRCLDEFNRALALYKDAEATRRRTAFRSRRRMDAAHFRENCYQPGYKNQALYQRGPADFDVAQHLRPEWLNQHLDGNWDDMVSLGIFLRRMGFTGPNGRKLALKLIFGHMTSDGQRKKGLQICDDLQLEDVVANLEQIAGALPELDDERYQPVKAIESERLAYSYLSEDMEFESIFEKLDYIESSARQSVDIGGYVNPLDVDRMVEMGFDSDEQPQVDDEKLINWMRQLPLKSLQLHKFTNLLNQYKSAFNLDITDRQLREKVLMETLEYSSFQSNPCSAFGLHYGEDAVSWELRCEIMEANMAQIKQIQKRMFPSYNRDGRKFPPVYGYFTPQQRSSFWAYVKARKSQLEDEYRLRLSKQTIRMIQTVRRMGKGPATRALIKSYQNSKDFESDTDYFFFSEMPKPPASDIYVLWGEYNRLSSIYDSRW